MKKKKIQKKENWSKLKMENDDRIHHPKKPLEKTKYRHKNHWLEEGEEVEFEMSSKFKMEEE